MRIVFLALVVIVVGFGCATPEKPDIIGKYRVRGGSYDSEDFRDGFISLENNGRFNYFSGEKMVTTVNKNGLLPDSKGKWEPEGGWKTTSKSSGLFHFSWSGSLERVFRIRLVFDDDIVDRYKPFFTASSEKDIAYRTLHLKYKKSYLQTVSKLGPWHDHRRFQITFLPKYGFEKNSGGERRLYKSIKNGARCYRLDDTKNNLWNGTEWQFDGFNHEIGGLLVRHPNTQKTFVEKTSGELVEVLDK